MTRDTDDDPQAIGQAILNLAARLPEGMVDMGYGNMQSPQMGISYEAVDEIWELEFCPLDPDRNFTLQDASLEVVVRRALERDREKAPDV